MPTKLEANASFKKPRLVFLVLALALIFGAVCVGGVCGAYVDVWDGSNRDTVWDGYGNESYPYLIQSAAELAGLAQRVKDNGESFKGMFFKLTRDIDLGGKPWLSIGSSRGDNPSSLSYRPFKGTFDGNGKTISNISQTIGPYNETGGLFGHVEGGTVTNVKLENVVINVNGVPVYAGSLVGILKGGNVTDCVISGSNIIKPSGNAVSFGFSGTGNVTVDNVIGDIRNGENVSIYGITSTDITISDIFSEKGITVDYRKGKNNQYPEPTYPEPTYKVFIPEELVIDETTGTGTMEINISVSGSPLPPSSIVKVYVSGDYVNGNFRLKHQADSGVTLEYVLSNETVTKLSNDDLVGTFTSENQNPIRLNATVSEPTLYSGTYTDKLTFRIEELV